jgi:hypothetical protein
MARKRRTELDVIPLEAPEDEVVRATGVDPALLEPYAGLSMFLVRTALAYSDQRGRMTARLNMAETLSYPAALEWAGIKPAAGMTAVVCVDDADDALGVLVVPEGEKVGEHALAAVALTNANDAVVLEILPVGQPLPTGWDPDVLARVDRIWKVLRCAHVELRDYALLSGDEVFSLITTKEYKAASERAKLPECPVV